LIAAAAFAAADIDAADADVDIIFICFRRLRSAISAIAAMPTA
jgi:hypothetical protein